ncbi:MAG TPA: hypothetical protein VF133_19925 [Terriglobales bacterium]
MKKIGLVLTMGLLLTLASAAAPKANAQVAVGVAIGTPVYVRPVAPYPYVAPRPYVAYVPAPVYSRVYVGTAPVYYRHWDRDRYYGRRDYYRHWDRDHGRRWDGDGRWHRDWR